MKHFKKRKARTRVSFIRFLSFFIMSVLATGAYAQQRITGKVVDKNNESIIGASITLKSNPSVGTVSDLNGNFAIQTAPNDILHVSYMGYISQDVSIEGKTSLKIVLVEDTKALDEVVVIGYGIQRKGDITSSIASIKSDGFTPGKVQDAAELIKGKVAGLAIAKNSGDPNASSSIMLRGASTLEGNMQPLVLVDGIPGSLTTVASENIESIDVLKDASAAAIYGTRGANGVIIITTKSGRREQKLTANYSGYVSISNLAKTPDFMDAEDIRQGKTSFSDDGYETDWLKAITRTAFTHNHSLSLSGGTKYLAYSANISYRNEEGTIKKSDKEQTRLQLNVTQYLLNDKVKIGLNLLKGYHKNSNSNSTDQDITNIYRQAIIRNPTSPIYDEDGSYYEEFDRYQYLNPVEMINERIGEEKKEWTDVIGNITVEPIKGWQTNLMLSRSTTNSSNGNYETMQYYASQTSDHKNGASRNFNRTSDENLELTSRYDYNKNNHRLSALVGYSYNYNEADGFNAWNQGFPTDAFLYNNLGVGAMLKEGRADMGSYKYDSKLIGFFGRVSYGYGNRYNVMVSLRREGSSKFGDNHKWGSFPSISAGWTISNEEFMKPLASTISNLKLRAGFGVTGITPNDSYKSLTSYSFSQGYYLNPSGKWVNGLTVKSNPNPNLKWEKTSEFNLGVDFGFFGNRLHGSIDVYNKETKDLLYWYNVPVPPNLYGSTLANVGSIRNRGIELLIGGTPIKTKDFEWNTTLTLSHNSNKLLNLSNDLYQTENYKNVGWAGDPIKVQTHRLEVGKGLGNFWGLKTVGVTDDGYWLIEDPQTGEALTFTTAMNSDRYRQYLGNGLPKLYAGWSNTFRYKNIDLNIQTSGQFGFKILNEIRMFYENNMTQYNKLKSAAEPVYGKVPLASNQQQAYVSYYLENGNYVKFDNITLGYTYRLPKNDYVSSIRFYASGQNLFCITGYSGLDPEIGNTKPLENAGQDFRDKYPSTKSLTFGLIVNF